jgi:hypothetical protein
MANSGGYKGTGRILQSLRGAHRGRQLLLMGVLILFALTAILSVLPNIPPFKQSILSLVDRQTSSMLSCNVSIGQITLDVRKGLVAKNVVLSDRHDRRTSLRADRAAAQIDFAELLRARLELSSIKIEGLSGELLNVHQGLFAGPVDVGRIIALIPVKPHKSRSMVRMISAERCTVSYVDSVTKISTREIVSSFRLDFMYADSVSFVMHAGQGYFSSPVWSGTVLSNDVEGAIGPASLLFGKTEAHGDSATLWMHGTIPFSMEKAWDLTANAEALVSGFPRIYKNLPWLKPAGKCMAAGAMTGSITRPVLKVTLTGYGLRAGSVLADSLVLKADYTDELLRAKAGLWSTNGNAVATVRAHVGRLFLSPSVGTYTITSSANNVDIRHFIAALPRKLQRSMLIADAKSYAAGSGLQRLPDTVSVDAEVSMRPIAESPVKATVRLAKNKWALTAEMEPDFGLKGSGRYTNSGAINGSLHVQADTVARIASAFSKESVRGSITADAVLSGTFRMPVISASVQSTRLSWRDIIVSKLWGRFTLRNNLLFIDSTFIAANGPIASALQGFVPGKFDGNVWVQAGARGPLDSLRVDGDVRLGQCSYDQYHADTVSAHCGYAGKSLEWQSLAVKRGTSALQSDGTVSWAMRAISANADSKLTLDNHAAGTLSARVRFTADSTEASVTGENLDPAIIAPWFPLARRFQGSLGIHGTMAGASENPDIRLLLSYDHLVSRGHATTTTGDLAFANGIATATIKVVQKGLEPPLTITAQVPVAFHDLSRGVAAIGNGAVVTIRGDSVAYGTLINGFAPSVQSVGTITLHGTVSKDNGEWGLSCSTHVVNNALTVKSEEIKAGRAVFDLNIAGPLVRPAGGFILTGDSIEYRGALITGYSGSGSVANEVLTLDSMHVFCSGGGGAELSAVLPVSVKNGVSFNKNGRVSATFTAMPFGFVQPFMPEPVTISKGVISGRMSIEGVNKGFPQGEGTLSLRNGECYLFECDKPLGPLSADIDFRSDSIVLRGLQAGWGGGHIAGKGWAVLGENGISNAKSDVTLRDVHVGGCYDNLTLGIKTADINLTKDSLTTITVNAVLADTRFTQDYSLIEMGKQLKRKAPQTLRPPNPLFNKVVMRVAVNLNSNLTFDSNLGKMLLDGTVTAAGRPDKPAIAGAVQIVNGFVYYLDRRFTVTQGSISQHDPRLINPSFDITANANVSWYPPQGGREDYDITLLLKGDLSTPVITLSAIPSLAQPQIISLLTFGTIQTGMGSDLGSRTGSLVGEQLAGLGTRKLARFLNVESVDINGNIIDPSAEKPQVADIYGNVSGPSTEGPQVSVTKQVSSRVAVTYSKGLSTLSQQTVLVSYRLLSFLYLEAETDQQAQGGIDLKFRYSH